MTFDEVLEAWARKNDERLTDRDITSVTIEHSESYTNEEGTHWSAETKVICKTRKVSHTGQRHYKTFEVYYIGDDPLEFARELIEIADEKARRDAEIMEELKTFLGTHTYDDTDNMTLIVEEKIKTLEEGR